MRARLIATALAVALVVIPAVASARRDDRLDPLPTDLALVISQPDGTELRADLAAAESGGALEVDGYSVVQGDDGWWRWAAGRDGHGGLLPATAIVGVDERPPELAPGLGRVGTLADGVADAAPAGIAGQLMSASEQAAAQAAAGEATVFRFPVVLFATWYDSAAGQTSPQFQAGSDTVEHFQNILDGFGGNPTGSLTEFYFENSYGQFLVQVDVLAQPNGEPYVSGRSSVPGDEGRCYYGDIVAPADPTDDLDPLDSAVGAGGGGAAGMAVELFNTTTLPADHDFSGYDNDGNGTVDFIGIIHSGADMAVTGDPCNTWSHAIALSQFQNLAVSLLEEFLLPVPEAGVAAGLPIPGQTVRYERMFTMPEFDTLGGTLAIGVATHEMAHALGEPDYYATNATSQGDGDWDIMAGGSYGGTPSGTNPTWFNPLTRVMQGWVTPTIIHDDQRDVVLERRSSVPAGYTPDQPNPNLLLVPTKWIHVGDTDELGHTWTERDVYGLTEDGDLGFVIEGFYLELGSRMPARAPSVLPSLSRQSYNDRWLYGSGLLTWHFDYWRRSFLRFGANGANDDAMRMQMDVEEWDFNDDAQELALNLNRADSTDVAWDAATGITSGTFVAGPEAGQISGDPQGSVPLVVAGGPGDAVFQVEDNPANRTMTVTMTPASGDCTLQLLHGPEGEEEPATDVVDDGFVGAPETAIVTLPEPGRWVARIADFLLCGGASGAAEFAPFSGFDPRGSGDTWSNWTEGPTGWAFTNIRTGPAEGNSHGTDAGGPGTLTLDIINLGETELDVSPGFARPAETASHGRSPVIAERANAFEVPIFANGGAGAPAVPVEVRLGAPDGPLVSSGSVAVGGYGRSTYRFTFNPGGEGGFDLFTIVDADGTLGEVHEGNNVQRASGWAGPADPAVLIVDDDGPGDNERVVAGTLAALGVPYAIAELHVSADEMAGYEAVIWVASLDREEGQLDAGDRTAIAGYLGAGGKVWLTSNRAHEALDLVGQEAFSANWFGVDSLDVDSYYGPVQFVTEDIFAGIDVTLEVLPGRPFLDQYVLSENVFGTATSLGVLQGTGTTDDGNVLLGARVDGTAGDNTFQTVTTAFSLSQVSDLAASIDLTDAVMDWFGVAGGRYAVTGTDPVVYHSQIRQTVSGVDLPVRAIVLGGAPGQPVQVRYRHHGIGSYTAIALSPTGGGAYRALIPAIDVTPDGIDYVLRAGDASTFDPRAAGGGPLANAVAVFLPEVAGSPVVPAPAPLPLPLPVTLPATGGSGPAPLLAAGVLLAVLAARGARRERGGDFHRLESLDANG